MSWRSNLQLKKQLTYDAKLTSISWATVAHVVLQGVLVEAGAPVQTWVVVAHAFGVDDLAQGSIETCKDDNEKETREHKSKLPSQHRRQKHICAVVPQIYTLQKKEGGKGLHIQLFVFVWFGDFLVFVVIC